MKKVFVLLMAGMLVLTMGGMGVAAAGRGQGAGQGAGQGRGQGRGQAASAWVDADGDGVCDNMGTGGGRNWVDEDGDGVCDNMGMRAVGRGAGRCQMR